MAKFSGVKYWLVFKILIFRNISELYRTKFLLLEKTNMKSFMISIAPELTDSSRLIDETQK